MTGLYLHIPFCKQKCLYCDFPSTPATESEQAAYMGALIAEVKSYPVGTPVDTIFVGGGTPTVLSEVALFELMETVFSVFAVAKNAEITIEANPGTLTPESLFVLRNMGFNRLSMGLQAWQDSLLRTLGRVHTRAQFLENYQAARLAGFTNINVDIMFSLPEQTLSDWEETLSGVIGLEPEHISAYSLIVEEGTPFWEMDAKGKLLLPEEDIDRAMYALARKRLSEAGYPQYELSNFAKKECRHNRIYWECREYIGVGLGAHSYQNGRRYHNTYDRARYVDSCGLVTPEDIEVLTQEQMMSEFMFMGLRLTEGVRPSEFRHRFGKEIQHAFPDVVEDLQKEGLLQAGEDSLSLTERGMDLANVVFSKFV